MKHLKVVQNLVSYFSKFKKVEKVKKKPALLQVRQRTANVLFYGFLVLIFGIGILGAVRAIGLASNVSSLSSQVKLFDKTLSKIPSNRQIDVSKVRQYMSDFLKVYITYDEKTADQRLKDLDDYFSFSLSGYTDSIKESRTLTGVSLIAVSEEADFYIADMKVSFETVEKGETVSRVRVLAIPFKMVSGLLAIVSPPYFKQEDSLVGETEPLIRKKREDVAVVDNETQESVKQFITVFFDKYASSNEVDLKLLMKQPFLMGGQYTIDSIQENAMLVYKEDKNIVVQVSVDFLDKGNGAIHTENFTLYLVNQENGWYVEKMYHYFK